METNQPKYYEAYYTVHGNRAKYRSFLPRFILNRMERYAELVERDKWSYFSNCKRILEVGAGEGTFLKYMPAGKEITVLSPDAEDAEASQGFNSVIGDIRDTPFVFGERFDGIHLSHVIEHLPDAFLAVKECYRLLVPGGILVIRTPNYWTNTDWFYDDPTHCNPMTPAKVLRLCYSAGFKAVTEWGYGRRRYVTVPLSVFPSIRLRVEKLLGCIEKTEIVAKVVK